MSCNWIEKISQLIDGELPEIEARMVQRHLNDCHECQLARTDFLRFRSEIASYVPSIQAAPQSDALNRILGKHKAVRGPTTARPRWNWRFSPRIAAFATVILLAAIVGFIVYRSPENQQIAPAQTANNTQTPVVPNEQVSPQKSEPREERQASTGDSTEGHPVVSKQKRAQREPERNLVAKGVRLRTDGTRTPEQVVATDMQSLTAMHLQKAELLLRAFRNVRTAETGSPAEIDYERKQARQLILHNMVLWREADEAGEIAIATLLEDLEPILLDIANLPDEVSADDINVINERVERKNIVALLQVNSTVLARALED